MRRVTATVSDEGQVTLPVEVRKHLGLEAHDTLVFVIEETGAVRLRPEPYPTIASLEGAAGSLERPLTWPEVETIANDDRFMEKFGKGR